MIPTNMISSITAVTKHAPAEAFLSSGLNLRNSDCPMMMNPIATLIIYYHVRKTVFRRSLCICSSPVTLKLINLLPIFAQFLFFYMQSSFFKNQFKQYPF